MVRRAHHEDRVIIAVISLLIALLFVHCPATLPPPPYDATFPMTREIVTALNGEMSVNIPKDWFATSDEKAAPHLLIWLVSNDYTATITLTEIKASQEVHARLKENGLTSLAMVSLDLKQAKATGAFEIVTPPQQFAADGRVFCGYEYTTDNRTTVNRIIVFDTGKRYYELAAVPFPKEGVDQKLGAKSLFVIQQSVLSTLRW